ncbi:MAG: immune inhibitor A [Candidatus Edwardsbacteria bacterium]|nr:immune inhibitor A [Candidatus Edwardsbacteria bacterium]
MQSRFRFLALVLAVIMIAAMTGTSFAIPANPRPRAITQPDGGKIQAVLKGDEHFHFAEDADGYSIIQNKDGWWTYAKQENGLLVATDLIVGKSECPFVRHLRPSSDAVAALPKNANRVINWSTETRHKMSTDFLYGPSGTEDNPTKLNLGRNYMNVVLGDFSDSSFAWYAATEKAGQNPYSPFPYDHSAANNHALATTNWFNFLVAGDSISPYVPDSSIVGSMSNFYFDCSYRRDWFYGGVSPVIATGVARASAVSGDAPTSTYYNAALTGADPFIDYDQNNDLAPDGLILIHPGPGQEESSDTKDIWSMSLGVSVAKDGVTIRNLIVCPQNSQLGVFAHEMFHQIGGPDLYDYGYSGTPWGEWSLMDNGSYNGSKGGDKPAFPGGHLAYDLDGELTNGINGWMSAGAVGNSDSISSLYRGDGQYTIAPLDSAGEARRGNITNGIRLWRIRNNAFRDSGQVFFVELRSQTNPYEVGTTESGLIITHIDTRMGGGSRFNDGPPTVQHYYSWVEQPGFNPNINYLANDSNFPRNPSNACYSANDFSAGGYTENAIDSLSTPHCLSNGANAAALAANGPWIYDISAEGPTMTFRVARTGMIATTPQVGYVSVVVKDPIVLNTANNNNAMLDPWETDTLKVTFRNTGTAITAGARCSLYVVTGGAYVESITGGFQTVGSGALATNAEAQSGPFVVKIKKDVPKFTDIVFGAVFRSTTPAYNTTSSFGLRVSGLKVVKTYDFTNIRVGGTTWGYRIQPSSVAVLADTVFISNANLDNAVMQTRLYAIKKNTTNNPLVGGVGGDTIRSLNNHGSYQNDGHYGGGIDIDNAKNLWISLQDSVIQTNRATTHVSGFMAPNCSWSGTNGSDYLKRIRGIAFGPSVIDTFGPDPMAGDSLWAYWQYYTVWSESVMVYSKPASGTAVKRLGLSWDEPACNNENTENGKFEFWNGRALEYDGSNIWTSAIYYNLLFRRNPLTGERYEAMPGPSSYGAYGTYGMGIEATNAAGVPYAPVGSAAFVRGAAGTRFYLYCASMDEGKIYKVDMTDFVLPTPPDSVKVTDTGADNVLTWWKANDGAQKVAQYIIYRQAPGSTTPPTSANELVRVQNVYGGPATHTYTDVGAGAKIAYVYTIKTVNYYGEGTWGASVSAPLIPGAVELTEFACVLSGGNAVTINWQTASEMDNYKWELERSADNENFTNVWSIDVDGTNPYGDKYSYTDQVPSVGVYYYRLVDISKSGEKTYHGPISVVVGSVYAMAQNYPNPIGNRPTTIKYSLKNPGQTSLKIYNLLGEEVKTLVNAKQDANFYTVHWDGRDNKGQTVSNGVYFYKLNSGEFNATKKMMVLR